MLLTKSQIKHYEDKGWLVLPDVFSKKNCADIKRHAEKYHDADYSVVLNIHRKSTFFFDIASSEKIVDIVRCVQKKDFNITNDQYLYKKSGTPFARQAWEPHQDSAYTNAPYGSYMQLHIMLDSQSRENGGIYFYPGSHKEPILPYTYVKSWKEVFDENGVSHPGWKVAVPEKYSKVDVDAKAGSIFLQHGNLIHGSYANFSKRDRAQYSIAYLNKNTKINTGHDSIKIPTAVK